MGFAKLLGYAGVINTFEELTEQLGGDVVYMVGSSKKYGVYLEKGTRKMPAYPWLGPAVQEYKRNPEGFVKKHAKRDIDELDTTDDVVGAVALAIEARAKDNVNALEAPSRSPGTHPEHPEVDTGDLRGSIAAVRIS